MDRRLAAGGPPVPGVDRQAGRAAQSLLLDFSEHIGFSIWSVWSVLVLFLPEPVFRHRRRGGAFGGVLVNLAFRQSFMTTGTGDSAYLVFIAFYVVCVAVTWVVYLRPRTALGRV